MVVLCKHKQHSTTLVAYYVITDHCTEAVQCTVVVWSYKLSPTE